MKKDRMLITGGCGFIGSHFTDFQMGYVDMEVIVVDKLTYASNIDYLPCLLYTSPSPRDLSTSRMPSSA